MESFAMRKDRAIETKIPIKNDSALLEDITIQLSIRKINSENLFIQTSIQSLVIDCFLRAFIS